MAESEPNLTIRLKTDPGRRPTFQEGTDHRHYGVIFEIENAPADAYAATFELDPSSYYDPVRTLRPQAEGQFRLETTNLRRLSGGGAAVPCQGRGCRPERQRCPSFAPHLSAGHSGARNGRGPELHRRTLISSPGASAGIPGRRPLRTPLAARRECWHDADPPPCRRPEAHPRVSWRWLPRHRITQTARLRVSSFPDSCKASAAL